MNWSGIGLRACILAVVMAFGLVLPSVSLGEDFKVFTSEEYGFTMKYPATWVKVEPKNYYLVFQAPETVDGVRSRIHVAAHKPVKDKLNVFLQELRTGIADLQKKGGSKAAQIIDESEFKSEVPGAYYFFLQSFDKVWQDVVLVFYKHDQTLLRISCLTASKNMEKLQPLFNEVLTSVRFVDTSQPQPAAPAAPQAPKPAEQRIQQQAPPPAAPAQPAVRPTQPATPGQVAPSTQQPGPAGPTQEAEPEADEEIQPQPPAPKPVQPAKPVKPAPRGPLRGPDRPGTGIVN